MIRAEIYDQKLAMARINILEYYPVVEKRSLFEDRFVEFSSFMTST